MNLKQIIFVEFKMYIALIFEKYRKASTFVNQIRIKNIFEIGNDDVELPCGRVGLEANCPAFYQWMYDRREIKYFSPHRFSSFAIIVQEVAVEQFLKLLNLICEILMVYHYWLFVCKAVYIFRPFSFINERLIWYESKHWKVCNLQILISWTFLFLVTDMHIHVNNNFIYYFNGLSLVIISDTIKVAYLHHYFRDVKCSDGRWNYSLLFSKTILVTFTYYLNI